MLIRCLNDAIDGAFTTSFGREFQQFIPQQLNKFLYLFWFISGLEILKSLPLVAWTFGEKTKKSSDESDVKPLIILKYITKSFF